MWSNLKLPESAWLTDWLTDKTVSYLDLYWPIWTNRINQNQPESTRINPYQPVSIRINLNQPESTLNNPNRPKLTWINPNQPESTRINPYQLVATLINGFHASGKSCGQNGPKFITPSIFCQISKMMSDFFPYTM